MENHTLNFYLDCFANLRCDKSKFGVAPHKPVLLIAIIRLFQYGKLNNSQIAITPDLEHEFEQAWYEFVKTPHRMNLGLPFYHMRNERFGWRLSVSERYRFDLDDKNKMKNLNTLKAANAVATLETELVDLCKEQKYSQILHDFLISRYFNQEPPQYDSDGSQAYIAAKDILKFGMMWMLPEWNFAVAQAA